MKVEAIRLGINGEGVAKGTEGELKDKVCFVPYLLPGEEADVKVITDKKSYCNCRIENLIKTSEDRVNPKCKYFTTCGGCDLQHLNKCIQLDFKRDKVKETLTKITNQKCDVFPVVRLNDYYYRNKMSFPIVNINNKAKLGMFKLNTNDIVDIDKCLLCKDIINEAYAYSKKFIENSNFTGYDFRKKKGDLKYLVIRCYLNKLLITIVSTKKFNLKDYYNYLSQYFKELGLSIIISNSDDEIMSGNYIHLYGDNNLELEEFDINYKLDNRGFLQVNNEVKEHLYNLVLDEITENYTVIDAYSGAGLLTAIMARKCKKVYGIEINTSASKSAEELSKINNLTNITCINGDVKYYIGQVIDKVDNCTVVLDPARSGCDSKVLDYLISDKNLKKVSKIIYISCNPATLSRDLNKLFEYYKSTKIIPLDMFPQTKHIETFVVLEKKN